MFVIEPRIRYFPASSEQVVSVLASLNKPHVAVPGKAPQEAQAYVVGLEGSEGSVTAFVYLYLVTTHEAVVYVDPERLRVSRAEYADAEAEAIGFVESMGFMLESSNYHTLSPAQRAELLRRLPCFQPSPEVAATAGTGSKPVERAEPPQVKLARFLAAF